MRYDEVLLKCRFTNLLYPWFQRAEDFITVMRRCSAVVSESVALAFFLGPFYIKPNDLDIYTPRDRAETLVSYLTVHEAYTLIPCTRGGDYSMGVHATYRLSKGDRYINVVQANGYSALLPICQFWSTILMNFVWADGYCCPYPSMLVEQRGLIHRSFDDNGSALKLLPLISKYNKRGITTCSDNREWAAENVCPGQGCCPSSWRYFGDEHCLVSIFPGGDDEGDPIDQARLDTAVVWRLGGGSCPGPCRNTYGSIQWKAFELSERLRREATEWIDGKGKYEVEELQEVMEGNVNIQFRRPTGS